MLFPTTTFEKATLAGEAETSDCTPVPLREIVVGEPAALLVIWMLPAALPDPVGLKVTVKGVFPPALIVFGAVKLMV